MTIRRQPSYRSHAVAALEQRQLLSGNVTAIPVKVAGITDIVVTGDSSSNSIKIVQSGMQEYTVSGTSGTKINGNLGGSFKFNFSNFNDVLISMNSGDDSVVLVGGTADFDSNLVIDTGAGTDLVNLGGVTVKGRLTVQMGDDKDKLDMLNSTIASALAIGMDAGEDLANLVGVTVKGTLTVQMGTGTNKLNIKNSRLHNSGTVADAGVKSSFNFFNNQGNVNYTRGVILTRLNILF